MNGPWRRHQVTKWSGPGALEGPPVRKGQDPPRTGSRFLRAETPRATSGLAAGPGPPPRLCRSQSASRFNLTFFEVLFQTQRNAITSLKLIILDAWKKGID